MNKCIIESTNSFLPLPLPSFFTLYTSIDFAHFIKSRYFTIRKTNNILKN